MAYSNFLVKSNWLKEHLQDDNLVIVDCQWDLNAYIRAHIPGAIMRPGHPYIKSEKDGEPSKHLPTKQEFLKLMEALGIDNETEVVCYDEWDNHFATRLWWLLYYYGHKKVRLLDGGWQEWVASEFAVSCQSSKPRLQANPFVIKENKNYNVHMSEVLTNIDNPDWQMLDVRSDEEFKGKKPNGNKMGGHIKGAIHLEWKKLLSRSDHSDGVHYFLPDQEMQSMFDGVDLVKEKTTVVYCQAGVRASVMAFCLEMHGYPDVRLYDGSMSEWANDERAPLEI